MTGIVPFVGAGTVQIAKGVATIADRSGGELVVTARSVPDLIVLRGRIDRALERWGRGERDVTEG